MDFSVFKYISFNHSCNMKIFPNVHPPLICFAVNGGSLHVCDAAVMKTQQEGGQVPSMYFEICVVCSNERPKLIFVQPSLVQL